MHWNDSDYSAMIRPLAERSFNFYALRFSVVRLIKVTSLFDVTAAGSVHENMNEGVSSSFSVQFIRGAVKFL